LSFAQGFIALERVMGIEPTLLAWEAKVLPLNYTRKTVYWLILAPLLQGSSKEVENPNKHHRLIRSFVRREGRMTRSQAHALETAWPCYGLEFSPGLLDFTAIFGREAPLVLEIGFGMGLSLLSMAAQAPEQDFIGIEVHRPGVGALLAGMVAQQVRNIRIFCMDAVQVLQTVIPDNSLNRVQIFFPDPWPKKRHHKRRLLQAAFIELLYQKLQPEGILHIATDWQAYAAEVLVLLEGNLKFHNCQAEGGYMPRPATRPLTKFEQRGQRLGHGVWDIMFTKTH
jgi:tRNA (guanine-N7-)-methyltransferase